MKYLIPMILLIFSLALPASAMEIQAPEVPNAGAEIMPEDTTSFGDALAQLFGNVIAGLRPDITEAVKVNSTIMAAVMMMTILNQFSGSTKKICILFGTISIASVLTLNANAMIHLGSDTVQKISDYGRLLLPVMAAALAAQGGISASGALYTGTVIFDTLLSSLIADIFVPMIYLFLSLAVANSAIGEDLQKRMRDFIKNTVSWCLKTLLTVFTTYMSITGVVSGTTDAATLKATKVTISSLVPVVGGILSEASEAVLVSAGVMKSAAGVYGILAILALLLGPFFRIGIQYLLLKATASLCTMFAPKEMMSLVEDFSTALGLLLAMTGSVSLLLLISTICFMKGVG